MGEPVGSPTNKRGEKEKRKKRRKKSTVLITRRSWVRAPYRPATENMPG